MRLIRLLGPVAVAALAGMAFAGVGTATADDFCEPNESPCTGNIYPVGTEIEASSAETVLTSGESATFKVTCQSTAKAEITETGGAEVIGEIDPVTFTGCSGSCKEVEGGEADNLAYDLAANATGGGNGTATATEGTEGNPGATLAKCLALQLKCGYATASAPLKVNGGAIAGANANIKAENVSLTRTFGACPATAVWNATYDITKVAGLTTGDVFLVV